MGHTASHQAKSWGGPTASAQGKAGNSMGRRQTAPRASVWPVVMYKLCPFSFLLCPLSGFGMHRDSLGQDWYSLCPMAGRVQSPAVMAHVQLDLLLPERRLGWGAHGCFWACRGPVSGSHMPWMAGGVGPRQRETQCPSTCAKEDVQCQNTGPSATAGRRDFAGEERSRGEEGWLDLGV